MNKCPKGKILNPKTNRCVLITGKIGQQILNPVNINAQKLADEIHKMIKNNKEKIIIELKNSIVDDNFYKQLYKNIGPSAKKLKESMSKMYNTERTIILYKSLYIVVIHFGDTDKHNSNVFLVRIFNNKRETMEFYDIDRTDDF